MQRKILHVTSSLARKSIGSTSHLSDMVVQQLKQGYDIRVAAPWWADDDVTWAEKLRSRQVVVELIGPVKGFLGRNKSIAPMLQRNVREVDIVHLHGVFSECVLRAAELAIKHQKPFIWHLKSELVPESWGSNWGRKKLLYILRVRKLLNQARALHYNSKHEAELAASLHLTPPRIIESVGITRPDLSALPPVGSFRQSIKIEPDAPLLFVTGNIVLGSGVETLVESVAQIRSSTQKVYLALSGTTTNESRFALESAASSLGMNGRLLLLPPILGAQKYAAMRDSTMTVLPWRSNTYPVDVLESLAVGTPVLLTNGCALHHEALEYRFGCVSAVNANDFTKEIIRILNSSGFRQELVQNGETYLREHVDFEVLEKRWESLYEMVLGPKINLTNNTISFDDLTPTAKVNVA